MSCRWCKIAIGLLILAALTAALYAILQSGGGAMVIWQKFIAWLYGVLVANGWLTAATGAAKGAAIKALGYKIFAAILVASHGATYVLADYIDWFLCEICKMLGRCEVCEEPSLNP